MPVTSLAPVVAVEHRRYLFIIYTFIHHEGSIKQRKKHEVQTKTETDEILTK